MALKCPNCSYENPDGSAFCQSCGRTLQQATGPRVAPQQPYPGGYPPPSPQPPPQQPYPGGYPPPSPRELPPQPYPGGYSPQPPQPPYSGGVPPQQGSVRPGTAEMYPPSSPPPISAPVQMGTVLGRGKQLFARRAFAGRGTSIGHESGF